MSSFEFQSGSAVHSVEGNEVLHLLISQAIWEQDIGTQAASPS